jgi:hypothetical protein
MESHDIYYLAGVFLPFVGVIGYLSARIEKTAIWFPVLLFLLGLASLAYTWVKIGDELTFTGFGDSVIRIIAAIF